MSQPEKFCRVVRDARGSVWEPLDATALARQQNVHVVITHAGGVRGNHSHRLATEILVVQGPALVRLRGVDGGLCDVTVPAGELRRFTIPPGVAHAIQNTGAHDSVLVSFSDRPHDPAVPDVDRVVLLEPCPRTPAT